MSSKDKPWTRTCFSFGILILVCILLTLVYIYDVGSQHQTNIQKSAIQLRHQQKPNITITNYPSLNSSTGNRLKPSFGLASYLQPDLSLKGNLRQPIIVGNQSKQIFYVKTKNPFYRLDTTPENTPKLPFLENFKNPCWREYVGNLTVHVSQVRCLPYFYMVGVPKAGTSDMHSRLTLHPSVSSKVLKEPHWVARIRFHKKGTYGNLSNYLRYFDHAVRKDILTSKQENGHYNVIFGDCSCSTLWDNWNLFNTNMRSNLTMPTYTNANVIYNLNPKSKIIIMLRNPTTRLYSDYVSFQKVRSSSWLFHKKVVKAINQHTECLRENSLRYCVHTCRTMGIRLFIGMYHIFVEDFFRVFPREQIKIIKTEDFSKNISKTMKDVFQFLEIGNPPENIWTQIIKQKKTNEGKEKYQRAGEMLPNTKQLLSRFYKIYNERLARLLGENFMFD